MRNSSFSAMASPRWNALAAGQEDRAIVIIRLAGGNDGLNTIIPLNQYDIYANARPGIKVEQNQSWNLSDEYAMPNYMQDLESLWGDGKMKVLHNVGYAEQNLSHFRSIDIWEAASDPALPPKHSNAEMPLPKMANCTTQTW